MREPRAETNLRLEINELTLRQRRWPDSGHSGRWLFRIPRWDFESSQILVFIDQFVPDSHGQSAFDVLRDIVPIHMSASNLGYPNGLRQLLVTLCYHGQIESASFSDQYISLHLLQMVRQCLGFEVMRYDDDLKTIKGTS